jgi:aminoglycoside phosphotransferase (APT) family kinase protein
VSDELDSDALRTWLSENLGFEGEPFSVETISGGRSNLTLGVEAAGRRLVVRRPPIGHFLPTAHDMSREYRVYRALHGTDVPVPEAYALCEDESVIGAPFYVMERLDGIVPHEPADLAVASADANARTGVDYAGVLAAIHGIDLDAVGLAGFGKPSGYLERQVSRWIDQWERSKQADEPAIDALAAHLRQTMPEQRETTLVHGDYRLGNVMLDGDGADRIIWCCGGARPPGSRFIRARASPTCPDFRPPRSSSTAMPRRPHATSARSTGTWRSRRSSLR